MKKALPLLLVFILSLIPTAPALAQGDDGVSPGCDPEVVINDFEFLFNNIEDFEDLVEALTVSGFVLVDCADDWLNLLMMFAMQQFGGDLGFPPMPPPPPPGPDGGSAGNQDSLTARDAETAIRAAFTGDIDTANQYVCPAEQLDSSEDVGFPDDLEINEISCQRLGGVMNCTYSISSEETGTLEEELNFDIVDELLCTVGP